MNGFKIGVRINMNVMKIEKDRLFEGGKGKYLDATVFIDLENQSKHGDNGFITQDVSKEEREAGIKGNILGNVTIFAKSDRVISYLEGGEWNKSADDSSVNDPGNIDPDDDLPF